MLYLHKGAEIPRDDIVRKLVSLHYERNDLNTTRGRFRVRGDTLEIFPAYEESLLRVEMFGDDVERLTWVDTVTGEVTGQPEGLRGGERRVGHHRPADRRDVRRRQVAQGHARRARLPAPIGAGQPSTALRRVPEEGEPGTVRQRNAQCLRAQTLEDGRRPDRA